MFSGSFSLLPSSGGGGSGSFSLLPSSGGGTLLPGGSTGGSWSLISTGDNSTSGGGYTYTAPVYTSGYSYQSSVSPYVLPGAGIQAGPFGERGPYTPLDFPLTRELMPGERLEDAGILSGLRSGSVLPYLALGIIAALLLK